MTTNRATRPAASEFPSAYASYVATAPDGDIVATLEHVGRETASLLSSVSEARAGHRYAPGKWSIKEVVGHLADAERVFAYRAMTFARGDAGPVPGFDEDAWVPMQRSDEQPLARLIELYTSGRASTLSLLRTLPDASWPLAGTANGKLVSVRALAWVIAGHDVHHRGVLQSRYLGAAGGS